MSEPKLLHALPFDADIGPVMPRAYQRHPDGGWTPTDPTHRGDVSAPCPHCGAPLATQVSAEYLKVSVFKCTECHNVSSGRAEDA